MAGTGSKEIGKLPDAFIHEECREQAERKLWMIDINYGHNEILLESYYFPEEYG